MALDDTIAILASHPLFAALPDEAVRVLAFSSDYLELPLGARLYTQGAPADAGFILVSGTLELEVVRDGAGVSAGIVEEGSLLGELALLCSCTRSSNALARTRVGVLKIPRIPFLRVLAGYPEAAQDLRQRLQVRVTDFVAALDDVRRTLLEPHIVRTDDM